MLRPAGGEMTHTYRADIDGLRAIAVAVVVVFHAFPELMPGGFVGVDVFFVISGFLITTIIYERVQTGKFSFAEFYARRIRRLFPALAVTLAVTLAIGWVVLLPGYLEHLGLSSLAGSFFVPNLLLWSEAGYFDTSGRAKPLLHLWSLGVEEQFYLLWPMLLVAFGATKKRVLAVLWLVVFSSLVYSVWATWRQPDAAFYSPLSRLWELGLGGLLALTRPSLPPWLSHVGVGLILASSLALSESVPFPGVAALVPVLATALVIASRSTLLARRELVVVGLFSYPLYLWHWPLLSLGESAQLDSPSERLWTIVLSVALAALTWRFIERPIRFGRARRRGVPASLVALALAAAVGAGVWLADGAPQRFPQSVLQALHDDPDERHRRGRFRECWLVADQRFEDFGERCKKGSLLVWGDSHAALLYPGLTSDGGVAQLARNSCMPLLRRSDDACARNNTKVLETIQKLKPQTVVLYAGWLVYWRDWSRPWPSTRALVRTIRELKAAGVRDVVVLGAAPVWQPELTTVVYRAWRRDGALPEREIPAPRDYQNADAQLAAIARAEQARFLSIVGALCDERGCLTHTPPLKSQLLSRDYGHFTTAGAAFVVDKLGL
jgi:peptidoglycan/LPS O-acetylase OafA/YrhL